MDLAEELRQLEDLHRTGGLTDEEYARAKAAVLAGAPPAPPPQDPAVNEQLRLLRLQNELAQLDHGWERQRQQYLVTGRYGQRTIPTPVLSILTGVAVVGAGVVWTALTLGLGDAVGGGFGFFPLFGVFFIVVGLVVSVSSYRKAVRYRQAYAAYLRRRERLLSGEASPENDEPRAG
jgi:hypothetical protein